MNSSLILLPWQAVHWAFWSGMARNSCSLTRPPFTLPGTTGSSGSPVWSGETHKLIALVASVAAAVVGVLLIWNFDREAAGALQFVVTNGEGNIPVWIDAINANYHVGLDGISMKSSVPSNVPPSWSITRLAGGQRQIDEKAVRHEQGRIETIKDDFSRANDFARLDAVNDVVLTLRDEHRNSDFFDVV